MYVTPASGPNLMYWGFLPMGVTNYGGDLQVFNLPDYSAMPLQLGFNPMGQAYMSMSAFSIFGGFGGFGMGLGLPPINMASVNALAQQFAAPVLQQNAAQHYTQAGQGATALKTTLNSFLLNQNATTEDREKANEYLAQIDKYEAELKALEGQELSAKEVYDRSSAIEKELRKIATNVGELNSKINKAATEAALLAQQTQQNNNSSSFNNNNSTPATSGITLNKKGNGYGPEFLEKVKQIANRLNCNYRDLLGLMNSESGIRADIKNPHGSASGLIQFVESTANKLGTTTAQLRQMSPIKQLDYVEKYLSQAKRNAGLTGQLSGGDLYSLVFLPGRANRDVLTTSSENYYKKNKGLDANKDGKITKLELGQRVQAKYVSDNSFLA